MIIVTILKHNAAASTIVATGAITAWNRSGSALAQSKINGAHKASITTMIDTTSVNVRKLRISIAESPQA
ncbi:MAG: hypothetical protein V4475_12675 [Pseudomonadota bacterium]